MKTLLVTVADDRHGWKGGKYTETQNKIQSILEQNSDFGIKDFFMWKWEDIVKTEFYSKNKALLDQTNPSMNGRVYKPLTILTALKTLNDGEFLIYTDCSPEMWSYNYDLKNYDLNVIKNLCVQNNGILTAHVKYNGNIHVDKGKAGFHTHENFTSERCLNKMCMQAYRYSLQHASGMIVLQKSSITLAFVEEWLYWNSDVDCAALGKVTDAKETFWEQEEKEFKKLGHRHDQSISGLLLNRMNHKLVETLDYYERPKGTSPYNFLHFCEKNFSYSFFDSNQLMSSFVHRRNDVGEVEIRNR